MNICGLMLRPRDLCTVEHLPGYGWWMRLERRENGGGVVLLLYSPVKNRIREALEAFMVPHAELTIKEVLAEAERFVFEFAKKP